MPLPPYAFVPGQTPHPVSDPRGHSFGRRPPCPDPPDSDDWSACQPYLHGIDLFNHGYYWEAHEVWEALWKACGRLGPTADFLKALIKLAAAGVKVREGVSAGACSHARRAAALLLELCQMGCDQILGLRPLELAACAEQVAAHGLPGPSINTTGPVVVFDFTLCPSDC